MEEGRGDIVASLREDEVFVVADRQALGSDPRGDHGEPRREGLEDLEPRPAADPERYDHDGGTGQVGADIRDVGMQLRAGRRAHASPQGSGRIPTHQAEARVGRLGPDRREDPAQELIDGVQVRPPVEAAHEQDPAGFSSRGIGLEVSGVDAILDEVDTPRAELIADRRSILPADRDDPVHLAECMPLEPLELSPLEADVPSPQEVRLVLVIAPPDLRLDAEGDRQATDIAQGTQGLDIGGPFRLPEVDLMTSGDVPDRPAERRARMSRHREGPDREEIGREPGMEARPGLGRYGPIDDDRLDPQVVENSLGLDGFQRIGVAVADVGDPVSACQPGEELERPNPLARVGRIGQFLVNDGDVHTASPFLGDESRGRRGKWTE